MTTEIGGPFGTAAVLAVPTSAPAALTWWLITAPAYHPAWSQYVLCVVTLEEGDDLPPPKLQFPGATHELIVFAVDPGNPPRRYTVEEVNAGTIPGRLLPINIAHPFTATDEEMTELAELACRGVVDGLLNPETADAPTRIRENWLAACVKTLAHMRGEEHAS